MKLPLPNKRFHATVLALRARPAREPRRYPAFDTARIACVMALSAKSIRNRADRSSVELSIRSWDNPLRRRD